MSWRDKVQAMREGINSQKCPEPSLPKPPKPSFVSFGSTPPAPFPEKTGFSVHSANPIPGTLVNLRKPQTAQAANDGAELPRLLAAAMKVCDRHHDSEAAREEMRQDCLNTPVHLRADLLAFFLGRST